MFVKSPDFFDENIPSIPFATGNVLKTCQFERTLSDSYFEDVVYVYAGVWLVFGE